MECLAAMFNVPHAPQNRCRPPITVRDSYPSFVCINFFLYSYIPPLTSPIEDRGPPESHERSRLTHLLFVYLYETPPLIERRRRVWDLI